MGHDPFCSHDIPPLSEAAGCILSTEYYEWLQECPGGVEIGQRVWGKVRNATTHGAS
ncbi:hypothetical protein PSAB6_120012 [Paraburkholderia sabiae]|nr:hypothetical protein PSAB6_120012 [Paraburkholderia sabiae]